MTHRQADVTDDDVLGLVMAGWSMAHGFATLWLTANLRECVRGDPGAIPALLTRGAVTLGELNQDE